ncbi:pyridoxamine 5'-phosphate oxidase family protein [Winogradskyella ursingii]|uniref:pyridoxamine 5'-phosphate oxidase family protein n=1 Tax=Winogradskyella ursingii TaxID=2686079 RepID=UPI0015CA8C55|nr:pyridoxamine 5'-phosphate oxidase family protein [Winogradskyella ursingii]
MTRTLDKTENLLLLSNNFIGSLGYIHQNTPIVVPITYFYNAEQKKIICYSAIGHKINAMRKNHSVSLSVTDIESVNEWKSVLIKGTYEESSGSTAKALLHQFSLGVKELIIRKELRDLNFLSEFSSKIENDEIPIVFTITMDEITGRIRKF